MNWIKSINIFFQINHRSLLFAVLSGCLLTAPAHGDNTAAQLKQLNNEMAELKKMLEQFKSHRSELQDSLRKSEVEIGNSQKKINAIEKQLNEQQKELDSLRKQRQQLKDARRQQQGLIEKQVVAAYQVGQQSKLKLLLNQEQPDKISRALTYYDYFNRARAEQITAYLDIISELNTVEPAIASKADQLQHSKSSLDQQLEQLISSRSERKKSLDKINAAIANKDQSLRQLSLDRAELEKLLNTVEQAITQINIPGDYRPFAALKGKLPWPVAGKPANRYGARRSDSGLRWQGLSIPTKEGNEIKAIHHGRVVFADWFRGSGLLVIVDHGDGYMSLYAHNQSLLAQPGDWVTAGETIATAGNSGGQANAGLYFEIRHNGRPNDPAKWCRRS